MSAGLRYYLDVTVPMHIRQDFDVSLMFRIIQRTSDSQLMITCKNCVNGIIIPWVKPSKQLHEKNGSVISAVSTNKPNVIMLVRPYHLNTVQVFAHLVVIRCRKPIY